MQATRAARGPGSWPVRRITGPQGPSRGSPSFKGLQTLLAPAPSVKTRRNPARRIRHVRRIRTRLESLPQAAISQPQLDYLITALGYCQPFAEAFCKPISAPVSRPLRSVALVSEVRFAQPEDNAIRICGCQGVARQQYSAPCRLRTLRQISIIHAAHCAVDCGEKQHYEAGHRHHHNTLR